MKVISLFFKLLLTIFFILFCAGILTFFLTVFMPTQVVEAIKIFQNIFAYRLTSTNLCCII
jgi:hypothetical protein